MSMKTMSIALLLLSMCVLVCTQGRLPTDRIVPLCCMKVSSADISGVVKGEPFRQRAHGPCVEALIFRTSNGKACVDPKAEWAKKFI